MKKSSLLICLYICLVFCYSAGATELDGVYKQWGNYNYILEPGLRIYYPDSVKDAMPRIAASFARVRKNILETFGKDLNYEATVILDDHDDTVNSTAESNFDWIKLSIIDEMDVLSSRSYSLEKRFALSYANAMIKRKTSRASNAWQRKIAMLLIPQWFIDGMALNYAFPLDSLHYSRLLDMARHGRLYTLNELATITSQGTVKKEEMQFQAHSMLNFWDKTYKKGADLDAVSEIVSELLRHPKTFDKLFKKHYGVTMNEAYNAYKEYYFSKSVDCASFDTLSLLDVDYSNIESKFFRSYTRISDNERVWVSSQRYTTENYDLFYRKGIEKPVILEKNVHPALIYNADRKEIIIGCYGVNGRREKRLSLYAIDLKGKRRRISETAGCFKPLGIKDGRVYYVSVKGGVTRIMSAAIGINEINYVNCDFGDTKNNASHLNCDSTLDRIMPAKKSDDNSHFVKKVKHNKTERCEMNLGSIIRPLDLAMDCDNNRIFITFQNTEFETQLAVLPLHTQNLEKDCKLLFGFKGDVRALKYFDGRMWCACDADHSTTQLFAYNEETSSLEKHTSIPGGVWDVSMTDPEMKSIELATIENGGFVLMTMPYSKEPLETIKVEKSILDNEFKLYEIEPHKYQAEYHTSRWKPVLGRDSQGYVLGIYNHRTDRLGRTNIVIAPTFGLKSHDWGYTASFMKRFDMVKATIDSRDSSKKVSYMETDYYERTISHKFYLEYPLELSTNIKAGIDLSKRSITKIEKSKYGLVPTEGKDHSLFVELQKKAIRTEPYNDIFPRKGRNVLLKYKHGMDDLFGGDMLYDSISLKWDEYYPLNNAYVLTLGTYIAEDDKKNNIRRPDDLSLGGDTYMRAYDGSYKMGDKLRYAYMSVARPINIEFPRKMSWIRNEFTSLGLFLEVGDVINDGDFKWSYDRGIELRSKILMVKRIPIEIVAGYAKQNGRNKHNSYCNFTIADLAEIFQ